MLQLWRSGTKIRFFERSMANFSRENRVHLFICYKPLVIRTVQAISMRLIGYTRRLLSGETDWFRKDWNSRPSGWKTLCSTAWSKSTDLDLTEIHHEQLLNVPLSFNVYAGNRQIPTNCVGFDTEIEILAEIQFMFQRDRPWKVSKILSCYVVVFDRRIIRNWSYQISLTPPSRFEALLF